ncbi:oocyte zinc finger protein XlCOF8.4-like [Pseudophryne corroboree]|uniref:oocyte zinc finger protein XlCOF8.4-like n=1 Tax=Pseudophryne corroboree TaxID=495146 RepID=UPI003081E870
MEDGMEDKSHVAERLLNITLEVIYLMTGEHYVVTKKSAESVTSNSHLFGSGELGRTQSPITVPPPHSLIHERDNEQKILELTNKIIQLLTGEVYSQGHRNLYKDLVGENLEVLNLQVTSENRFHATISSPAEDVRDVKCTQKATFLNANTKNPDENSTNHEVGGHRDNIENIFPHIRVESSPCGVKDICSSTDQTQVEYTCIKIEESDSCDGDNLTDTDNYTPTYHTPYSSTHIKEEPVSCDGGDLTHPDNYGSTGHTQYTSTHSKEEPALCDGGNLTDTGMYTPIGHTQYTSTHIKEEPVSCDGGDLTHTDMYTPTGHIQYTSTHIKEEPASCDGGDLTHTDMYTPTGHTQYTCTHIKEEPSSCDGGDLTHTDMYTPAGHTQYTSTHIKEDPASCDGGNPTDTDMDTSTDHAQYIVAHIKEECVSCDGGNLTDTGSNPVSLTLTPSPVSDSSTPCVSQPHPPVAVNIHLVSINIYPPVSMPRQPDNTQNTSIDDKEEPMSSDEGDITDTDLYTPTNHTQYTSTHAKEENQSEDQQFVCLYCLRVFSRASNLVRHVNLHSRESPFVCTDCGKSFDGSRKLLIHQKSHSGENACPDCGKCFPKSSELARHLTIHSGEQPYCCSKCGEKFNTSTGLNMHQGIQTGADSCSEHGKCSVQRSTRNNHLRTRAGQKPFSCIQCGKLFVSYANYIVHRRLHAGEKPHRLSECGKCCRRRSNLSRHLETSQMGEGNC